MYDNRTLDIILAFNNNESLIMIAFLVLITVIRIDKSIAGARKRFVYAFAFLCMCYTFLAFIDFGIGSELLPVNVTLRLACSTLRHIMQPIMIVLNICYMSAELARKKIFYVPVILNTLLYLINIGTNICFTITGANQFEQTPLNHITCVVFVFYFVVLAITYLKHPYIKTVKLRLITCVVLYLCIAGYLVELLANRNVFATGSLMSMILMHEILTVIQSNEQLKYKDRRLEDQKNALMVSQIQPHFIYNTLNIIYYLCQTDAKLAGDTVIHFSDYLRENLLFSMDTKLVPVEEEIEHTRHYTDIELLRFPNLTIDYEVSDSDYMLPPLSIQPLVENAIRHGVRGKADGVITIQLFKKDGSHMIVIRDNGVGMKKASGADITKSVNNENATPADGKESDDTNTALGKHSGLGIINVSERLESLCDGHMEIVSNEGQGTTITLTIPEK